MFDFKEMKVMKEHVKNRSTLLQLRCSSILDVASINRHFSLSWGRVGEFVSCYNIDEFVISFMNLVLVLKKEFSLCDAVLTTI